MIRHIYEFGDDLPPETHLDIQEYRGEIVYRVNPNLTPNQLLAALNQGAEEVLSGGHWFQEWHGDIITRRGSVKTSRRVPEGATLPKDQGLGAA